MSTNHIARYINNQNESKEEEENSRDYLKRI